MSKPRLDQGLLEKVTTRQGRSSTQALRVRISTIAAQKGVSSEAVLVSLAQKEGIGTGSYFRKLPVHIQAEVRSLTSSKVAPVHGPAPRKAPARKTALVTVGKTFELQDPLLSAKAIQEAKAMSESVYPLLYVFENSVREVVLRIMHGAHGADWWKIKVSGKIQTTVKDRKAREEKNPWHGKRGAHEIYYTDLEHLGNIVQAHWPLFKKIIPSANWLTQRLEEMSHSRNPVAHMNPLNKEDVRRVEVYFGDWNRLITNKRAEIP